MCFTIPVDGQPATTLSLPPHMVSRDDVVIACGSVQPQIAIIGSGFAGLLLGIKLKPVSYTHLDVYKRQLLQ